MTNTNTIDKMTTRAARIDECLAEMSEEGQQAVEKTLRYIEKEILAKGAGEMSAKELLYTIMVITDKDAMKFEPVKQEN